MTLTRAASRYTGERRVALPRGARGTGMCERQRATPRQIERIEGGACGAVYWVGQAVTEVIQLSIRAVACVSTT